MPSLGLFKNLFIIVDPPTWASCCPQLPQLWLRCASEDEWCEDWLGWVMTNWWCVVKCTPILIRRRCWGLWGRRTPGITAIRSRERCAIWNPWRQSSELYSRKRSSAFKPRKGVCPHFALEGLRRPCRNRWLFQPAVITNMVRQKGQLALKTSYLSILASKVL